MELSGAKEGEGWKTVVHSKAGGGEGETKINPKAPKSVPEASKKGP